LPFYFEKNIFFLGYLDFFFKKYSCIVVVFFPYLFKKTNLFNLVEFTVRNVIFFIKKIHLKYLKIIF